jgi:hypothetical protein
MFSIVPTCHWFQGKCAKINLSLAASGMILQNHRLPVFSFSFKFTTLGSWKQVTGRIFKIGKEQEKNLSLIFSSTKETKNFKNQQHI